MQYILKNYETRCELLNSTDCHTIYEKTATIKETLQVFRGKQSFHNHKHIEFNNDKRTIYSAPENKIYENISKKRKKWSENMRFSPKCYDRSSVLIGQQVTTNKPTSIIQNIDLLYAETYITNDDPVLVKQFWSNKVYCASSEEIAGSMVVATEAIKRPKTIISNTELQSRLMQFIERLHQPCLTIPYRTVTTIYYTPQYAHDYDENPVYVTRRDVIELRRAFQVHCITEIVERFHEIRRKLALETIEPKCTPKKLCDSDFNIRLSYGNEGSIKESTRNTKENTRGLAELTIRDFSMEIDHGIPETIEDKVEDWGVIGISDKDVDDIKRRFGVKSIKEIQDTFNDLLLRGAVPSPIKTNDTESSEKQVYVEFVK